MIQASAGAENNTPIDDPMLTIEDGSARLGPENHSKMQ